MPIETLRVIELSSGKPRIVIEHDALPLLRREGDTDYRCGACKAVLVEQVWQWEVRNVVFKCPSCGVHNEIRK